MHPAARSASHRFRGFRKWFAQGGNVNFDVFRLAKSCRQARQPRKVVALVRLDNNAPIRKDTVWVWNSRDSPVVAAISLTGGAGGRAPGAAG